MSVSKKIKVGEGNIQLPWKTTLTLHKNSEAEYSFHLQSIVFIYNYPTYCSNLGLVKLKFFFLKNYKSSLYQAQICFEYTTRKSLHFFGIIVVPLL